MSNNRLLSIFIFFLVTISCDTTSFVESDTSVQKPYNLKYIDVLNAREGRSISTIAPTIDTGGLIPVYELVSIEKADGTVLDESYLKFVSIGQTITKVQNVTDVNGDVVGTRTTYDASLNGRINIADGNNFTFGDYYFTIKLHL